MLFITAKKEKTTLIQSWILTQLKILCVTLKVLKILTLLKMRCLQRKILFKLE